MRLAFDQNVSNKELGRIARLGYEIVYVAGDGESDEEWLRKAIDLGAERVYSSDLDIPNLLDKWGLDKVDHKEMPRTVFLTEAAYER